MKIVTYADRHFGGIDALGKVCFPDSPPRNRAAHSIPAKRAIDDDLLLVAENEEGAVIGSIMAGYDGHRGWLYSVAVLPSCRRGGIGARAPHFDGAQS
ncbi:GNAT family N-acetyltransferase [Erythrobacter litoralis]|uniref:Acetyltransferase, GNAT family protein n=1 Tax=Erythrobacter litoralis (strain HTCC2594) TaxID=314225 RepID=Q2N6Y9_ERYLH|nr:GNAT family N-acetyltransferase [Erythrobacter litoralis]ABC64552.1 acetyltransferase, GNAT family protein [Erythrobacter litoralis HTCC2594]